jgi:hypothetical protein
MRSPAACKQRTADKPELIFYRIRRMPRIHVMPVRRYFIRGSGYSAARQRRRFHGMRRELRFNKIRFDVCPMDRSRGAVCKLPG